MKTKPVKSVAMALALASFAGAASAAFIQQIDGNDCSGVFGQGFAECRIADPADARPASRIIIKFDSDENEVKSKIEINPIFSTIDGSEFVFQSDAALTTGTWIYTPGEGDPLIHWFVAKAGNGFNLFSHLGDAAGDSWYTPAEENGRGAQPPRGKSLSHFSFYGTSDSPASVPAAVPEPGSCALAFLALGVLATLRRRPVRR